uniref:Wisp2 protein n=1 Tax=Fopius arisanus TaxID=64838 RepID=A0A0C9QL74_9HYME
MRGDTIFLLTVWIACVFARSPPQLGCEDRICPGPLKLYKELGCTPIKQNPDDCCAIKYDCDHLQSRPNEKCHAFGQEYNPGETLARESTSCYPRCTCIGINEKTAAWACATIHPVFYIAAGCYLPRNATMCFPGSEICPPNPDDRPKCEVDGKTYYDGEYFEPQGKPKKACWCGPGYKGENVMPFCREMQKEKCGYELSGKLKLEERCAPVWRVEQDHEVECSTMWRCEEPGDKIIPREQTLGYSADDTPDPRGMSCQIGNLRMRLGDELDKMSEKSNCIKCICDIPPVATCVEVPKRICLMTPAERNESHEKSD